MKKQLIAKTLAAVTAAVILGGGISAPVGDVTLFTANAAVDSCCSFDEETGTLTLHGNVNLDDVRSKRDLDVKKVVCEENTILPANCRDLFNGYKAEIIDLSNADTSNVFDMTDMFSACDSLVSLDLSNFNTSEVRCMKYMFFRCTSIESLDLSSFDTSNVADMNNMFGNCSSLTSLDLSSFNTSKVHDMSYMFTHCKSLVSLDLSNFNTSEAERMEYMFEYCSSIESLDLSSFDTSKVADMNSMFSNCDSLTSLDLSNFNTSNVNDMTTMFSSCDNLESLDVSSFDTSRVAHMSYMFDHCPKLSNLDVSGFYVSKDASKFGMFLNCYALYPDIVKISSTSATVDGGIDINFHIIEKGYENSYHESSVSANLAKIVISGPNGDRVFTNFSQKNDENKDGIEISNGRMIFPYYLTAAQANEKVTIKAYDKDDNQLILCNPNLYYSLCSYSQVETSLNNYLNDLKNYNSYKSDEKLQHFVSCLEEYCKSAENYFKGTKNKINSDALVHFNDESDYLDYHKPTFGDDIKISLVLNSEPSVRIYSKGTEIKIDGETVTPQTSKYGTYYEITKIPVRKLKDKHTLTVDGVEYTFSPLSYCYRTYNKSDVMNEYKDLKTVAWCFYAYALAASNLIENQYLYIEK